MTQLVATEIRQQHRHTHFLLCRFRFFLIVGQYNTINLAIDCRRLISITIAIKENKAFLSINNSLTCFTRLLLTASFIL